MCKEIYYWEEYVRNEFDEMADIEPTSNGKSEHIKRGDIEQECIKNRCHYISSSIYADDEARSFGEAGLYFQRGDFGDDSPRGITCCDVVVNRHA